MNKLNATIIKAGLIVGTLDISSAFIYVYIKSGRFIPAAILKFVASGIFGKTASAGGMPMIMYGLVLHYAIAFAFTVFFFWLYPKLKIASKYWILEGVVYGIFIWTVMNLIVVPLSNVPARPANLMNSIINALILIVCIGLPLAYMATVLYKKPAPLPVATSEDNNLEA